MKLGKRKPTGREKDEAAIKLLEQLRHKLHSEHSSVRRLAAFKLSWMQEDGLEILQEALFGDFARTTKTAAAYGLRKMQGRMKKMALEVLQEGSKSPYASTRSVCKQAIKLFGKKPGAGAGQARKQQKKGKIEIREVRRKTAGRQQRAANHQPRRRSGNR